MIYVTLLVGVDSGAVAGSIASTTKEQVSPQFKHPVVALRVARDHPAMYDQHAWEAPKRVILGATWDRQLIRKPQAQIDAEEAARQAQRHQVGRSMMEVLLDLINEERAANGRPAITMSDVRARQEPPQPAP